MQATGSGVSFRALNSVFINQKAFLPKCLVFRISFPGETPMKEQVEWKKDWILNYFSFCFAPYVTAVLVLLEAMQHRDIVMGDIKISWALEKGTCL